MHEALTSPSTKDPLVAGIESAPPLSEDTENKDWQGIEEVSLFVEKNLQNQELHEEWYKKYIHNPHVFFDSENFQEIRQINPKMRALFLVKNCTLLSIRTSEVEHYFDAFPEDFEVIHDLLLKQGYSPDTSTFFNVLGISARYLTTRFPHFKNAHRSFRQYLEISNRRDVAPDFLLEGTTEVDANEKYAHFGTAADGFRKTYTEAIQLSRYGDRFLDTEQMLTPEYKALSLEMKREFLQECLRGLQFSLVFEEANNSAFTKERVEEDRRRAKQYSSVMHNSAHSILYKTYQPNSVYEREQNFYTRHMNESASIGGRIEEFPFHRLLITILKEIAKIPSNTETSDLLVDFWNKNRNPIFGNAVAEALSKHEPAHAAKKILQHIRQEKDNIPLASILYRLELGRIGISAHGVKYLEKLYDLGELNNPDYCAERLTALGDIGIFDEQKKLLGYFNLGDLASDETVIKAEVLEITKDLLFHLTGSETPEEIAERENILYEFVTHYHEFFGKDWLAETDIRFNNLSFGEQGWFMQYVKQQQWVNSPEKIQRDQSFFKTYGETGIKTFLALEQGMRGDKIVDIGLLLPQHLAEHVFQRYSDIVGSAENISQYLNESLSLNIDLETQNKITQKLLKQAKDLLVDFSDKATHFYETQKIDQSQTDKEKMNSDMLSEFDAALRNVRVDIELFANTFRALRENNTTFSLEDFEESATTTEPGTDIPSKESNQMRTLYLNSMLGYPEETRQELIEKFDMHLVDKKSNFTLLRYKGKVAGFLCFTETKPGQKYVSAVTLDPRFQKAYIGEAMIDEAFAREAGGNILGADCVAQKSVSARYIENGFIGIRSWDDKGDLIMDIVRDDQRNGKYFSTKSLPQEEIVHMAPLGKIGSARVEVVSDPKDHSFSLCNEGFVLTRYFKDKATKKWYLVYEPKPTKTPEAETVGTKEEALA